MPFYVYILKCADGFYYNGYTDDIEVRIDALEHQLQIKEFTHRKEETYIAIENASKGAVALYLRR